jgi:hypothetical protein
MFEILGIKKAPCRKTWGFLSLGTMVVSHKDQTDFADT